MKTHLSLTADIDLGPNKEVVRKLIGDLRQSLDKKFYSLPDDYLSRDVETLGVTLRVLAAELNYKKRRVQYVEARRSVYADAIVDPQALESSRAKIVEMLIAALNSGIDDLEKYCARKSLQVDFERLRKAVSQAVSKNWGA